LAGQVSAKPTYQFRHEEPDTRVSSGFCKTLRRTFAPFPWQTRLVRKREAAARRLRTATGMPKTEVLADSAQKGAQEWVRRIFHPEGDFTAGIGAANMAPGEGLRGFEAYALVQLALPDGVAVQGMKTRRGTPLPPAEVQSPGSRQVHGARSPRQHLGQTGAWGQFPVTPSTVHNAVCVDGCWLKTPLLRFSAPLRWKFTPHFIPGPSHWKQARPARFFTGCLAPPR
jgi:hypothetical protein